MRKFHERGTLDRVFQILWDIFLDLVVIVVIEEYVVPESSEIGRPRDLGSCPREGIVPSPGSISELRDDSSCFRVDGATISYEIPIGIRLESPK